MSERVALVTGASSGIGRATAERLLQDGFTVYAAARRVERMHELEARGAVALRMDVTDEGEVAAALGRIEQDTGGIEVLVNNAGFGLYGAVEEVPLQEARYQFEVNVFGLARVTQAVLPAMRQRRRGRIVNITSMGGKIYVPLGAWYHATKHALEGWSDCLRLELAPFGVHVIIVEPGIIRTEFGEVMLDKLQRFSGAGAYARMARALAAATRDSYERGLGSPPEVVARAVSRAVRARRPKTRYAVGRFAKPMIFLRKWFGDRLFDRAIMSRMGG